jgi:PAS domain S-box-containing protein
MKKEKREALFEWEKFFQSMKTLAITLDADRNITSINPAALAALNLSEEETLGKKCYDLLHQKKPPDNCPFEKASVTKQMEAAEIELGRAQKTFLVSCTPLLNKKGNITGALHLATDISERKRAEKESEEQYRAVFENTGTATVIIEEDTTISLANREFERLSGYSRSEIEGKKSWTEFVVKEDLERMKEYHYQRRAQPDTAPKNYEFRFIDKKGEVKEIFLTIDMIPGTKKSVASLLDITEQKETELELKRAKRDWEVIFQAIGHPTILLSSNHEIVQANQATQEVTGLTENELKGKRCFEVFHGTREPPQECPAEKMLKSGRPETVEMEMETLEGVFLVSCTPIFDEAGNLKHIIHIATDITERKQLEEGLKKNERFLSNVFSSIQDGLSILDKNMNIIKVNPTMERWYSHSMPLVGKKCYKAYHQRSQSCKVCPTHRTLKKNEAAFEVVPKRGPQGEVVGWFNLYTFPLFDFHTGKLIGVIEYVRDITEQKKAEDALKQRIQAEKALSQLSESLIKAKKVSEVIEEAISLLGKVYQVDRVLIFQPDEAGKTWSCTYEWQEKGVSSVKRKLQKMAIANLGWEKTLKDGKPLFISNVDKLPTKAKKTLQTIKMDKAKSYLAIPIFLENKLAGIIGLATIKEPRDWQEVDAQLIQAAGEMIVNSLAKERYQKNLSQTLKDLEAERKKMEELARKTIEAQESERLYLSSEIHDDLLQGLVATLYFLQMIDVSPLGKKAQERKEKLLETIKSSIERGRKLIREIEPLREPEIDLNQAIERSIGVILADADIEVNLTYPQKSLPVDLATKTNILRIIQEALMNVRKHSKATEASIRIFKTKSKLKVEISDNGVGFDYEKMSKAVGHYGLLSMRERAKIIGGTLTIESAPGQGTLVKGAFPLKASS